MTFRGKTKSGEWVEGYYRVQFVVPYDSRPTEFYRHIISDGEMKETEIIPDSLSMSTGLTDKNGKMIFGSIPVNGIMSKGVDCEYNQPYGSHYLRFSNIELEELFDCLETEYLANHGEVCKTRTENLVFCEIIGNQYEEEGK